MQPLSPLSPALSTLFDLLLSAGVGLLIGLEREFAQRSLRIGFAGVRTFIVVTVLGFLAAVLAQFTAPGILLVVFLAVAAVATSAHFLEASRGGNGSTTEYALLVAFVLGALVHHQQHLFVVACAVLLTFVLSLKIEFQAFVARLGREDILAALKLIVVTVLVLPLLSSQPIDPFGIVHPREIWLVVALVLTINFVAYLAMKFWSSRGGLILIGLLGGLVSSTAVTWLLAKKSNQDSANSKVYAIGVLLALIMMFLRVLMISLVLNREVGVVLMPLTGVIVVVLAAVVRFHYRTLPIGVDVPSATQLGTPFNLGEAVRFAFLYTGILLFVHAAKQQFGTQGVYLAGFIGGIADVDAITVSLSQMAAGTIEVATAGKAIVLAVLANNILKLGIAVSFGSAQFRRAVLYGFVSAVAIGALALGVGAFG